MPINPKILNFRYSDEIFTNPFRAEMKGPPPGAPFVFLSIYIDFKRIYNKDNSLEDCVSDLPEFFISGMSNIPHNLIYIIKITIYITTKIIQIVTIMLQGETNWKS